MYTFALVKIVFCTETGDCFEVWQKEQFCSVCTYPGQIWTDLIDSFYRFTVMDTEQSFGFKGQPPLLVVTLKPDFEPDAVRARAKELGWNVPTTQD